MSAAHTPAPWLVVPYGDGDSLVICEDAAGDRRIAFMATPGCRDLQSRRAAWRNIGANARLIAAAPEMVEALKFVVSQHWADAPDALPATTIAAVSAAIAKAEGRS